MANTLFKRKETVLRPEALIYYTMGLHLKVIGVISVRHQIALISALQLETVSDAAVWFAVFAIATEVGQTFAVA